MKKNIRILAIDTSCDDTSVAILENDRVLSSIVSSQDDIHQEWGGIVPSLARRAHQKYIDGCVETALKRARIQRRPKLDGVAVTQGPGLALSLEVGIIKAKELAQLYQCPLIPINHMEGHLLSPFLKNSKGNYHAKIFGLTFPCMALIVSGGHTEIIWIEKPGHYKMIGQTLDDAAGEAFDKVARMLDLGYPGGAVIQKMGETGDPDKYPLPRPMSQNKNFDFSFSGLKTACLYGTNDLKKQLKDQFATVIPDYCASFQEAVVDSLLLKMKKAIKKFKPRTVLVGGGVSANNRLRKKFRALMRKQGIPVYFPHKRFCMDNAAMIGLVAYHHYRQGKWPTEPQSVDRIPNLCLTETALFPS